jgi:hypothetical protein
MISTRDCLPSTLLYFTDSGLCHGHGRLAVVILFPSATTGTISTRFRTAEIDIEVGIEVSPVGERTFFAWTFTKDMF